MKFRILYELTFTYTLMFTVYVLGCSLLKVFKKDGRYKEK